ncbi:DUF475 domain-containing protein [uncultured Pelagimonas sp.]|uniref:DUF475 domain-containing protein n=1 Tax=uncultured Pelagimonas sp. TaxID=1618102 RepID=UPI00262E2D1C|nr:DUF475 domain-containing protein [uncultured Pelagimonas sp.]
MSVTSSRSILTYFSWAFAFTALGLLLSLWVGWSFTGTVQGMWSVFFICLVLSILEISLSFDNAVVNANILKRMDPVWQKRFLTWGILIAVFGMRIVFPVMVVSIAAGTGPIEALKLAVNNPDRYAEIMHVAHPKIAAFGGAFLLMVALSFFFDPDKDEHWFGPIERGCTRCSVMRGVEAALALVIILIVATLYPDGARAEFVTMALYGMMTFFAVEFLGRMLDSNQAGLTSGKAGLGAFLYLEVLDASFSFDGVIGAFALSQNLFVIAIGLGIGAMYVRSMTIALVEREVLSEFRFLEHGAFYAILVLAVIMFIQPLMHIPEVITGLIGVVLIGAALKSSYKGRSTA